MGKNEKHCLAIALATLTQLDSKRFNQSVVDKALDDAAAQPNGYTALYEFLEYNLRDILMEQIKGETKWPLKR